MDKIQVVFWTQSGNTQAMAEAIGKGITEAGKEANVVYVGSASLDELKAANAFAPVSYTHLDVYKRQKVCSTKTLYNALVNNWQGYETLHQMILHDMPRYGNGIKEADVYKRQELQMRSCFIPCLSHRGLCFPERSQASVGRR